jgi:hypothetical protein
MFLSLVEAPPKAQDFDAFVEHIATINCACTEEITCAQAQQEEYVQGLHLGLAERKNHATRATFSKA